MVKFKGKEVEVPGLGKKWLPFAFVRVLSKEARYFCEMLVDSGADVTLIPRSLGEFLRLSFKGEKIREIRGLGEAAVPYIIKTVDLQIGRYKFPARIGVALIEEVPLILGRLDVFDNFNIEFRQRSREAIFRRV